MSRPRKRDHEKKRILIQLRLTENEKRTLREFAKLEGMNITDFIKFHTLSKSPRIKMATPDRAVLLQLLSQLSKIGSNINQVAKVMNTESKANYSVAIKETYITKIQETIANVSSGILRELSKGHGENF
jgi:uncharacterized protein (DUF1778 family)